jgi:hypothetical protein
MATNVTVPVVAKAPGALPILRHLAPLLWNPQRFLRSLPYYGDLVEIRIGPRPAVVVCDPALTDVVFKHDARF